MVSVLHLTNRFHVAVRPFSNRLQMTSSGKNKEVAHEQQASVSLMFLPHFDIHCDLLLNGPTATWNLFVLYNDQKRKKTDTHTCLVPLDCSKICAQFRHFFQTLYFVSASLFLYLTCLRVVRKVFNVFFCSKQNNGENILQNSESLVMSLLFSLLFSL